MVQESAIVFYEASDGPRGILIRQDGEEVPQMLRERFKGSYKAIVEWIESGITGGGYLTAEDIATYKNPGDSCDEIFIPLDGLTIALSSTKRIYRINKNGTISQVTAHLNVEFVKD